MLAKFIDESGQTRTAWAERFGISRAYLSDILNGKKEPSTALWRRISGATGLPLAALIESAAPSEDAA